MARWRTARAFRRLRFICAIAGAVLLLLGSAPPALAAAGDLDTSFGGDGKVTTKAIQGWPRSVAIQANGKIVAAGSDEEFGDDPGFALARYNPDGTLDTTYGVNGEVFTNFSPKADWGLGAAMQADGKMVVAGGSRINTSGGRFALARYNTDGTLDSSFGGDGKVTTDFTPHLDFAHWMGIQADGKIVAAGVARNDTPDPKFAMARYNTDGSLDTSFGGDGKVTTNVTPRGDEGIHGLAFQADGKIVAVGPSGAGFISKFAVARYNTDGSLDTSFDADGVVRTDFTPGEDDAFSVTIQADGKIIAAGGTGSRDPKFALARYNTDGSLDTTFGGNGRVRTNFTPDTDFANFVAIQGGKIVVNGVSVGFPPCCVGTFALARYNMDGSLDPSFGGDGKVSTNFTPEADFAFAAAFPATGKLVVVGAAGFDGHNSGVFAIARYLST